MIATTFAVSSRELTLRALLTGLLLGALLAPSNVYSGLKIGWSFNMSIIALLIGFAFWQGIAVAFGRPRWSLLESNITQTTASSCASIISGGLVAPIPAYTLLTGQQLDSLPLMAWVFSVSFLGVWVAWYLRPSLIVESGLRFPEGMATLATLQQIYSHGAEAGRRLWVLGGAAVLAAGSKLVDTFFWTLPRWAPSAQLERLTFSFEPSLLLLGFGGIIGLRVGLSLLLGAVLAWGLIAPWLLAEGLVRLPAAAQGPQFAALIEWLLWPGVSLMVCATLTSLGLRLLRSRSPTTRRRPVLRRPYGWPAAGFALSVGLVLALQVSLFGIDPWLAALSIPLALPAVATWKAVAEALTGGLGALAADIRWAMLAGALCGVLLGTLEGLLPERRLRWLPSSAALGLAFIIPASISLMMTFGAVLAWAFASRWRSLGERFVIVAAAGLVAGESMAGVGASLWQLLR